MKKTLLILALFTSTPSAMADDFSEIKQAALSLYKQDSNALYVNQVLAPDFESRFAILRAKCIQESGDDEPANFDIGLELDDTGSIVDSSVAPETPVAGCLRDAIREAQLPKPPQNPFYAVIPQVVAQP